MMEEEEGGRWVVEEGARALVRELLIYLKSRELCHAC